MARRSCAIRVSDIARLFGLNKPMVLVPTMALPISSTMYSRPVSTTRKRVPSGSAINPLPHCWSCQP